MAFNVWFRIWPAQQKIITAVKEGTAPDAALVSLAGTRSRHNIYMSVPLLWAMINQHTTTVAGGNLGIPESFAFVTATWSSSSSAGTWCGTSTRGGPGQGILSGKGRRAPRPDRLRAA